ncbi:hypothetical protein [Methylocystis echinoides]|jgi:uncharacterized membrane-anchored protein YhcB (DUF1043 family)|uniref:Uncharacterized protein n=1 Tax=Methylocystis echinoides TaxID=29468 RepID=A0A9W6GVK6_9HYPH|nr:hypothetical protein [Methylocystis echinoides]GLI93685.1 hypothetical protein LMG27198_26770 [Methylocystis echinoides]
MQRIAITALSLTLLISVWFLSNWSPLAKLALITGWLIVLGAYLLIRIGKPRVRKKQEAERELLE